jgi:hypothetical protein
MTARHLPRALKTIPGSSKRIWALLAIVTFGGWNISPMKRYDIVIKSSFGQVIRLV